MENMILLHGALGNENDLFPLKEMLSAHYNVYTFNFSGHGFNEKHNKPFNIQQFTQDLSDFIDSNNIRNATIFGYSMGGYVALNYAATFTNTVQKVFTLGTKFNWTLDYAHQQTKFLVPEKLLEKVPAYATSLKIKYGEEYWGEVVNKTAIMMLQLASSPLLTEETLKNISCKVVISQGDKDEMLNKEESKSISKFILNATFIEIPDSLHAIEKVNIQTLTQHILNNKVI